MIGAQYLVLAAALAAVPAPQAAPRPSVDNVYWMVACLAGHGDHEMDRVLATVPGGDDSTVALFHAMAGDCLVAEHPLAGRDFFLRGAIAERLLYRDFEAIGMPPRHRATAVFAPLGRDQLARMSEAAHQLLAMLDIAACVARMEPAKVYAFFGTARGSAAERAAMTELAPAISACLFQGQTFNLTPPIFRAFLAEGAYRVAAGQTAVFRAGR